MQPIHSLFITPNNLRQYASYVDSDITVGPRIISVTSGNSGERLIEIPIASAGKLNRSTSVRITVSLSATGGTTDKDPYFGITDGTNLNEFYMRDNYVYPCLPASGSYDAISSSTSRTPGVFTFMFTPFYRYGICSVTKDGGYTVAATFNPQLDLDKDISFRLRRGSSAEQYQFYYFLIEFFE